MVNAISTFHNNKIVKVLRVVFSHDDVSCATPSHRSPVGTEPDDCFALTMGKIVF